MSRSSLLLLALIPMTLPILRLRMVDWDWWKPQLAASQPKPE